MASATEEEETELRDKNYGFQNRNNLEKENINDPIVQIKLPLPPESGGALQFPPPATAIAAGGAALLWDTCLLLVVHEFINGTLVFIEWDTCLLLVVHELMNWSFGRPFRTPGSPGDRALGVSVGSSVSRALGVSGLSGDRTLGSPVGSSVSRVFGLSESPDSRRSRSALTVSRLSESGLSGRAQRPRRRKTEEPETPRVRSPESPESEKREPTKRPRAGSPSQLKSDSQLHQLMHNKEETRVPLNKDKCPINKLMHNKEETSVPLKVTISSRAQRPRRPEEPTREPESPGLPESPETRRADQRAREPGSPGEPRDPGEPGDQKSRPETPRVRVSRRAQRPRRPEEPTGDPESPGLPESTESRKGLPKDQFINSCTTRRRHVSHSIKTSVPLINSCTTRRRQANPKPTRGFELETLNPLKVSSPPGQSPGGALENVLNTSSWFQFLPLLVKSSLTQIGSSQPKWILAGLKFNANGIHGSSQILIDTPFPTANVTAKVLVSNFYIFGLKKWINMPWGSPNYFGKCVRLVVFFLVIL
ncbi:hypothetical protein DH2020_009112 [Rehmannia glutinosa]|uniref:Uncharacterized protein n=1 Tax=Rehmannia glutinosa TaxID=99300 RepID=A0ABR0X8N3_REHGL